MKCKAAGASECASREQCHICAWAQTCSGWRRGDGAMGLKETDNYSTGRRGADDDKKLPRLSRGFRSTLNNWVEDMRGYGRP